MRPGTFYQKKFSNKCLYRGENVDVLIRIPGGLCPGAFNPYTNEYDPTRDREYHAEYPLAPICEYGEVNPTYLTDELKAFVGFSLKEELIQLLGLDEFRQGDIIIFFPYETDLSNAEAIEYPVGSGKKYGIFKTPEDGWSWDNEIIYRYAHCRLITTSAP